MARRTDSVHRLCSIQVLLPPLPLLARTFVRMVGRQSPAMPCPETAGGQFKIHGLFDSAVQHCGLATSSNMAATFAHVFFLHQVVCLFVFVVLLLVALVN